MAANTDNPVRQDWAIREDRRFTAYPAENIFFMGEVAESAIWARRMGKPIDSFSFNHPLVQKSLPRSINLTVSLYLLPSCAVGRLNLITLLSTVIDPNFNHK